MCQNPSFTTLLLCLCFNTAFAQSVGRGPSQPQDNSPDRCRLDETSLQGVVELRGDCRYEQGFEIDEPDVVLIVTVPRSVRTLDMWSTSA